MDAISIGSGEIHQLLIQRKPLEEEAPVLIRGGAFNDNELALDPDLKQDLGGPDREFPPEVFRTSPPMLPSPAWGWASKSMADDQAECAGDHFRLPGLPAKTSRP